MTTTAVKNWCSCLDLTKSQRKYHNHDGYPCLRYLNGNECSAERIDDQKWVPILNGQEIGSKSYRTKSEATERAISRATRKGGE